MTHPFVEHRAHKHEKSRVAHIVHGYATGGVVMENETAKPVQRKAIKMRDGQAVEGSTGKSRADRPNRKKGGPVHGRHKGVTVNVIAAPHGGAGGPMPPMVPPPGAGPAPAMAGPPRPPMMPPPGAGGPPGMPPGMPPRRSGGAAYAKGGAVKRADGGDVKPLKPLTSVPSVPPKAKSPVANEDEETPRIPGRYRAYRGPQDLAAGGIAKRARGGGIKDGPTWKDGIRSGTPMQNNPAGKNDQIDVGRKRVITYRTGGAVEHKAGSKPTTPHLPGGAGGGLARLRKEKLAKHATNGMAP